MKKNKKGFTLIELLAVIIVLAIVMAIAAGAVMNTIASSRRKSFYSTLTVVQGAIKTQTTLATVGGGSDITCTSGADGTCATNYDLDPKNYDMSITEEKNDSGKVIGYIITLNGLGEFAGDKMELDKSCPLPEGLKESVCTDKDTITAHVDLNGKFK